MTWPATKVKDGWMKMRIIRCSKMCCKICRRAAPQKIWTTHRNSSNTITICTQWLFTMATGRWVATTSAYVWCKPIERGVKLDGSSSTMTRFHSFRTRRLQRGPRRPTCSSTEKAGSTHHRKRKSLQNTNIHRTKSSNLQPCNTHWHSHPTLWSKQTSSRRLKSLIKACPQQLRKGKSLWTCLLQS